MRFLLAAPLLASLLHIPFRNQPSPTSEKYLLETMTGGVALLDYDRDGRLDVFLVNGAALRDPMPPGAKPDKSASRFWNRLYRNTPSGWEDVTEKTGTKGHHYGMGVASADYNNDGRPDLFVTNYGRNILYRNDGTSFHDVTSSAGLDGAGWSTGAAFLDFDRDGDLDLFVARYLEWDFSKNKWCGARKPGHRSFCHPDEFSAASHRLYRNDGGRFHDVSANSGIAAHPGKGLGVAVNDANRDGWPDIAVANDSYPQQLFLNRGDGTFSEEALEAGFAYDEDGNVYAGMGIAFEDFDNDGWPDLFVNALANQRYWLYRNTKGRFEPVSSQTRVGDATRRHSGWGTALVDYDNDGWRDLFVAQSHVMDNIELTQPGVSYREHPLLLKNVAGIFQRAPLSGAGQKLAARGAAFGDIDGDGFIDAVMNCVNESAVVHRNPGGSGRWIDIRLSGRKSNRDGIGAAVTVTTQSGRTLHGYAGSGGSYLSANDLTLHFGLGAESVRSVEIRWPSGITQVVKDPSGTRLLIEEPD